MSKIVYAVMTIKGLVIIYALGGGGFGGFCSCCDKIYLIPHKAPQYSYDKKNIYTIPPSKPLLTPPHPTPSPPRAITNDWSVRQFSPNVHLSLVP